MKSINLLLVDDHPRIRAGIKLMLKKNKELKIIAEASNGKESIAYLHANPGAIDLILMDISMPEMNGMEAAQGSVALI